MYFYSRPCGRGDATQAVTVTKTNVFLLTPLREGRREGIADAVVRFHFYSRPCGRGDVPAVCRLLVAGTFLLTPLREGRRRRRHSPA